MFVTLKPNKLAILVKIIKQYFGTLEVPPVKIIEIVRIIDNHVLLFLNN